MKKAKKQAKKRSVPKGKREAEPRRYAVAKDQDVGTFKGQQKVLLKEMGEPVTAEELTARVAKKLTTRQAPARVVAYYLNQWLHRGVVTEVKP